MKEAIKPTQWCNSPYFVGELSDLYTLGSRVDAWRNFLLSEKIEVLKKLDMSVCSFNRYDMFDSLIIMLDCNEDEATTGVKSIMVAGCDYPVEFYRTSIHDLRAWATFPLSCFTEAEGFNDWKEFKLWQRDILKFNPMPRFKIGINKKWVVPEKYFKFSHKLKLDHKSWPVEKKRYAQISFGHPQLDFRFENNQHVTSGFFDRNKPIAEVRETLMVEAAGVCKKNSVEIV